MVGGGSSSKRKSFKRKSSKISSEARKMKKGKRSKSKKLSHRDDSTSSVSVSSYSSRDNYKNKRTRSRRQKDVRTRRKRAQRSSCSGESSEDSLCVRKRKRSKRVRDSDFRKKNPRKKLRRDVSISSTSSDSWSCSTFHDGRNSKESEPERSRKRHLEENQDGRDLGKDRSGTKQTRYRSPSYSSRGKFSGNSDNCSGEKMLDQNYSSRLRSIITVIKPVEDKEEKVLDKDEEIVYDHDDYPSSRSNDSNEGGSKREIAQHEHIPSEKRGVENEVGERVSVSKVRTTPVESVNGGGGQHDVINHTSDYSERDNPNPISITAPSEGDELESILRQKALENLRRFRRGVVANENTTLPDQKAKNHGDAKQLLAAKIDSIQSKLQSNVSQLSATKVVHVQNKSSKQDESNVMMALPKTREYNNEPSSRDFIQKSIQNGKSSGTESVTAKKSDAPSSHGTAVSGNPKENHSGAISRIINKSELVNSAARKESLPFKSSRKEAATSQETPKVDLLVTGSAVSENATEKFQTAGQNSGNASVVEVTKECRSTAPKPSCDKSSSLGNSSKEPQDEAKDGSQYQQKTMSVMRGGEMVQVSYKVYIPKNAPALARRKLQP